MQHRRRPVHALQALTLAALLATGGVQAGVPAHIAAALPRAEAAGSGRLTWWGFDVYDAQLWVAPGFRHEAFDSHSFALELRYLRALRGADIAAHSVDEMQRLAGIDAEAADRWRRQLQALVPDVRPGDRIAGVHRAGRGVTFLVNGRTTGEIEDPRFATAFFAIWLAPGTREPALRAALLGSRR